MSIRWEAPDPRQLPEWRADMAEYLGTAPSLVSMSEAIHAGRCTILPTVPGLAASPGSVGAVVLNRSERDRLERAALYYATADMTALALAAADTPPTETVTLDRLPSPAGLILFAEPIGGYTDDVGAALASTPAARPGVELTVTTPIVAVSWSVWSPDAVQLDEGDSVRWVWNGQGKTGVFRPGYQGIWLTFYSPRGLFSGLAPDTVIGSMADGTPMTAGDIEAASGPGRGPALSWDNEMLLTVGASFGKPEPDTTDRWAQVLYTTWQLMAQDGRARWAETEEIPRARSGAKRDRRAGITGPSAVRVVRVHATHRPAPQAAQEDAQASTGRREPQWSCRWPVRPYRRNTCLNPHAHADGGCTHEDRIVPGHIKGPQGAPLRTGTTVHLWDRQPD